MEASSPLAALQPGGSFFPSWGPTEDASDYNSIFLRPCSYRVNSFNFRDMSMAATSKPDYFSCRPIRGSSPAGSLAVDLSQNFHIDKSPQLPTPRRSLFTSTLLDAYQRPNVVTPPIPSSSPLPQPPVDSMDFSPLPHKQPQVLSTTFALCSPTPEATPVLEQEELAVQPPFHRSQSQPITLQSPPGRRRASACVRPTLRKGYSSTACVAPKPRSSSSSTTPFMFGAGSTSFMTKAPPAPPLESFAESPPSERKVAAFNNANRSLRGPSLSNSPFLANGSPVAPVRRPPLPPPPPPRGARIGMGRRSQSVQYSNPFKPLMMRQEKRCCTTGCYQPSSIGLAAHKSKLPHFIPEDDPESLPRITKETAVELLSGAYTDLVGSHAIIDCRFEYEYQGGHIDGAHNYNDKEDLAKQLFELNSLNDAKVLIFHCEYSACRAPRMASFIRQHDRTVNQDNYPFLTFPEIYILDGGYSGFFKEYSMHCFPQNYVEMNDEKFESACELGMAKVKRRAKLSRAQTYAFGQTLLTTTTTKSIEDQPLASIMTTSPTCIDSMDLDSPSLQAPAALLSRMPRRLDSY